jgi:hypothetical protein
MSNLNYITVTGLEKEIEMATLNDDQRGNLSSQTKSLCISKISMLLCIIN